MKAGFFEMDITPAVGMERPASYDKRYIESIHDQLKTRAAVFDDGLERIALIGVDTCLLMQHTIDKVKKEIHKLAAIKPENVLMGPSHTHTGGPLMGFHPEELQDAPPMIRRLAFDFSVNMDQDYESFVVWRIATAVKEADRLKEKVLISAGHGEEKEASFNRRFKMKCGKTWTNPGQGNPDIVGPAGPIDPEVGVIGAWREDGNLLGCVINFTCHGTTFNGSAVSADWIGYMEKTVKGGMSAPNAVTVFLNGACGDVTQWNHRTLRKVREKEDSSGYVGGRVGAEVIKVLVSSEKGDLNPVKALSKKINLKRRVPSQESIIKAQEIIKNNIDNPGSRNSAEWSFAKERLILDYLIKEEPEKTVDIQAIQIGHAVFLSLPGELFCQSGLNIKAASEFPFTWVVYTSNGGGYVPTEDAFAPDGGGYETVLTAFSCLEIQAAAKIEETCIELSRNLTHGSVPEGPQLSEHGNPWGFGILGPEIN